MSTKVMIQLIADYFKTQPVLKAWLFGSFARGEETEDSDLDILVEYDKNARISLLGIVNTEDSLYIFAWKFESFQR